MRRGRQAHRFLNWQVGLFFLGAGVLVGGMLTGDRRVTGGAIVILLAAMLLGMLGRRMEQQSAPED